jgi:epoxide hydrolase-like predicted phosphatase
MNIPNPYRALIWDMGGVLVRNMDPNIRGRLGEPYGMTYMDLENLFFGNEVALKASIGQATEADSWDFVQQKLNIPAEEMPEFMKDFYSCDKFDEELYSFTMQLKPRYQIGLLSNAYPETRASLARRFPHFFNMFDVTIFSADVGIAKPDPEIYHLVLEGLGVEARSAVFVDDFIENVEGARAVGMHAIHFRNSRQVQDELKELFV